MRPTPPQDRNPGRNEPNKASAPPRADHDRQAHEAQNTLPRYGCQEFREDSERYITGRAEEALRQRYEAHRLECSDCLRFHHRLARVYEGPRYAVQKDEGAQDLEFEAILSKTEALRERAQKSSKSVFSVFGSIAQELNDGWGEGDKPSDWEVGRVSKIDQYSKALSTLPASLRPDAPPPKAKDPLAVEPITDDSMDFDLEDTHVWHSEQADKAWGPLLGGVGHFDSEHAGSRTVFGPVISGSAAVLAVGALLVGFQIHKANKATAPEGPKMAEVAAAKNSPTESYPAAIIPAAKVELEHRSQRFGRVIRGQAEFERDDGRVASAGAFRVGTTIQSHPGQSVQFALSGKMLVSMTDEARVRWSHASAESIQLEVDHGTIAVRYDRQAGEPTLLVRTPKALVRVTGTVFTVQADEHGDTSVAVLRGKVEVRDSLHPKAHVAQVSNGFRFDSKTRDLAPLGIHEVKAALPLSDSKDERSPQGVRKGGEILIPTSWHVPGLSQQPGRRTLSLVPENKARSAAPPRSRPNHRRKHKRFAAAKGMRKKSTRSPNTRTRSTGGWREERLIQELMDQAVEQIHAYEDAAISEQIAAAQRHCNELYSNSATRFSAARCLQGILDRYPNHPRARSEALVAIGILRMDYARDYQRAIQTFRSFLKDYGDGERAELVSYRLVVAHVESGDVQAAYSAGRRYVQRYPNGAHLGHILQRFPELKSLL